LIVTDWPALYGGTERYVGLLRNGLKEAGEEVRVLTSSAGSMADGEADYVAFGTARRPEQAVLQVFNPWAARTLRRAMHEFRPDAVHLTSFFWHLSPAVLAPLQEVPTLLYVADYKPFCPIGTKLLRDGSHCWDPAGLVCRRRGCVSLARLARETPRYGLARRGLRGVDHVATISRWMQRQLATEGMSAELVYLPVLPPGPGFVRRPSAEPAFVYAGRLAPVKGVDAVLRAFSHVRSRVPRARLRVIGDGPERPAITKLAAQLGLGEAVSFRFGMSRDWFSELEPAWALVAPSAYREPFGLVAAEAVVRGVPVIATDGGGFTDTVEPGVSGLLVSHGNEVALAEAMEAIATGRALPGSSIDPRAVEAMRRKHDPSRHIRHVQKVFARIGGQPRREAIEIRDNHWQAR
jgi:glycosyltransferase involved in cell wall biosynthesis